MGSLVTLVMSDIVGSTRRWAADEVAMAADLEQHDRILGEAVGEAGGTLVKHTGDGMLAMFDDPAAAVDAAAAIQRTVGAGSWRHAEGLHVRVAVHAGLVHRRDNDLFGTAVNRVARLLGVCPPGAVLVSGVVANMLAERALNALALRRVGAVALKGFSIPEEVHALAGSGLASVEAVVASGAGARGGRLPSVDDALVGRDEDLARLWEALAQGRLVTLLGVGGMGKTRLALEVAAGATDSFADGAWWIDLSAAASPEATLAVAMTAVEAREVPGRTRLQAFTERFAEVSGLVVFDNCEHVLPAAREIVEALRAATPEVRILTTSREALGLRGERILPVDGLAPEDALRLFAERARAVRPDLDIQRDRPVIGRICNRLDGIPLAIELAAARCRSMTPAEIDARLDDRFRLLRGGRSGAERHRTLLAAVSWSYSLLEPEERRVFERLAVFAGGATLEAVAEVCELDEFDTLDVLDRLIGRSMLMATRTAEGTRYHLLETLRQFAEGRLSEAGQIETARTRHLAWVSALAATLPQALGLQAESAAYARFGAELDNLRAAVAHALATGQRQNACEIVALVHNFAYQRPAWEVFDWVRPVHLHEQASPAEMICGLRGEFIDWQRGTPGSGSPLRSRADLPAWYASASLPLAMMYLQNQIFTGGDLGVVADLVEAARPQGEREQLRVGQIKLFIAYARQWNGYLTVAELEQVRALGSRSVALARHLGDARQLAMTLVPFAAAIRVESPEESIPLAKEAADIASRLGAGFALEQANRIVIPAMARVQGSPEHLSLLRAAIATAAEQQKLISASQWAMLSLPLYAHNDPDAALRLFAVIKRTIGMDRRRDLEAGGLAVPEDLAPLMQRTAHLSLGEAIQDILAACDQAIATASRAKGAS